MEKQKESKLNWALTVVDSEEAPNFIKFQGKQKQMRVWGWGEQANVLLCISNL